MYVITGCRVEDGDVYCWVVDAVNTKDEAEATVARAKIEWDLDYGIDPYGTGVEFGWSELEGTVQR